ncbi:MAG: NADAR family protein, partial [Verrucomicrobiales bacterium]
APIPEGKRRAKWEIDPSTASPGETVILSKRNELGKKLSNLANLPIVLDEVTYGSVESLWQCLKFPDPELADDPRLTKGEIWWGQTRASIAASKAWQVKRIGTWANGRMRSLRINWVSYRGRRMDYHTAEKGEHYLLIKRAIRAKLEQHPDALELLRSTGSLRLLPDHDIGSDADPAWRFHEILMELRAELFSN